MHSITLKRTAVRARLKIESAEHFKVTGVGVRNRHSRHQIRMFTSLNCCDFQGGEHLHLSAMSTVIALYHGPAATVLDVAIGDLIEVDGKTYQITAQRDADPVLLLVDMHSITLNPTPLQSLLTGESGERFDVTGVGVYNRHSLHEIRAFASPNCCDFQGGEHLHLSSLPTEIAVHHGPAPTLLDLAIGDLIKVDGKVYRVTAQRYANPVLLLVV